MKSPKYTLQFNRISALSALALSNAYSQLLNPSAILSETIEQSSSVSKHSRYTSILHIENPRIRVAERIRHTAPSTLGAISAISKVQIKAQRQVAHTKQASLVGAVSNSLASRLGRSKEGGGVQQAGVEQVGRVVGVLGDAGAGEVGGVGEDVKTA